MRLNVLFSFPEKKQRRKSKIIWSSHLPNFKLVINAAPRLWVHGRERRGQLGCVGVAAVCKRSTPPSAFPPWAVTSHERPVLVPADWQRGREREREENKSHQPHLSVSHTTGYYYFFRGISLFPSSCHFFAPLFVLRSFLSWRLPTAATRLYSAVSTAFISALLILFIAPSGLTERSTDQLTDWQLLLEDELDSVNMVPFWI